MFRTIAIVGGRFGDEGLDEREDSLEDIQNSKGAYEISSHLQLAGELECI